MNAMKIRSMMRFIMNHRMKRRLTPFTKLLVSRLVKRLLPVINLEGDKVSNEIMILKLTS